MIYIPFRGAVTVFYHTRVAEDYGVGWDVDVHVTVRGNQDIISDSNVPHNSSVDAYPNSIAYRRNTLTRTSVRLSDNDSPMNIAVSAYARIGINGDIKLMADI